MKVNEKLNSNSRNFTVLVLSATNSLSKCFPFGANGKRGEEIEKHSCKK